MILSIGMIVKNEEKYLEQCLTALKPILENVDSELIIADTGSTDRTVEIAKKFTDNVFHFEWINDFAAARNSTLDKAKGEWYMFIDADEIIKDCTPLIEFFNSGEYKDYGSATLNIRNYNDLSRMDKFNSYSLRRLTALKKGVRFTGAIHEGLNLHLTPAKNLNIIADHYGYVYMDNGKIIEGVKEKKTSRNLELLFQKLEEEKAKGKVSELIYSQIVDCYFWLQDYENASKYVELGLENCSPTSYVKIDYISKKLRIMRETDASYNEIIEFCKFYFSKDNLARKEKLVTDSIFYFTWAVACYNMKDYTETINKAVLGFDIYRSYTTGKLFTPELKVCGVEVTIPTLKMVCKIFLTSCSIKNKYDIAAREMDIIPLKDFMPDLEFMKVHLAMRADVMEHTNYNKLPDLYYQLDDPNRKLFVTALIRNIFKTEKHEHLIKKLNLIAGDDERLADIIKIYTAYFDKRLVPAQISEFIEKHGTVENETVWILMMKKNFDTAPFICAKDFNAESIIMAFIDLPNFYSAADVFTNSISKLSAQEVDILAKEFGKAVYSATERDLNTAEMIVCLGKLGRRWTELNPGKQVPENIAFALDIGEAAELFRKKLYDESAKRLEELIGDADPDSDSSNTKILRHYLMIVQNDTKNNAKKKDIQKSDPQTTELAEQIKQLIREMIDHWDLDGAEDALNQIAKLAPFDPDIENIRDEIHDRKINYMKYM